jgi:sodium ion-translocating decarboxylase beta subunit
MFGLYESALTQLTSGNIAMLFIGAILIYLGIAKKMEPLLLVPIGFGIFMVNLPIAGIMTYTPEGLPAFGSFEEIAEGKIGVLNLIYYYGLNTEIIPLLIFLGVGTMMDFSPTIARPISLVFGATAQLGVFVAFLIAHLSGMFTINEAACIGIIGGSDGPPTVYLTVTLAPVLLGPITMVAYSYMALVPILQPPVIRLLCTQKEKRIFMKAQIRKVSQLELILFPIIVFIIATLLVPKCAPLVGMMMFGNLLKVSGVTERLARAGSALNDILIILLGICVGGLMPAQVFFTPRTLLIIGLAIVAFIFSTAGGILSVKFVNLFLKQKINPIIGAAGVSAIPMAARVAQKEGQRVNPQNYLLLHALGPNMAGAIGTSLVAGILMGMLH